MLWKILILLFSTSYTARAKVVTEKSPPSKTFYFQDQNKHELFGKQFMFVTAATETAQVRYKRDINGFQINTQNQYKHE
jgi:hypothetical protein